ncbi:MAG: alpha/beta hydrolase, partial [Betaproteobacteria bacterium]|nr:alpha/beta hydrolase [Betaproteobacteria bacterium]
MSGYPRGAAPRQRGPTDPLWATDRLAGFEAREFSFADDYDGAVVATLVRLPLQAAPRGPVLYVHGFIDYFFQRHMAERFAAEGYAFHALDLRKHGRSLRAHQHPNFCSDIGEYFADVSAALDAIGEPVLLAGHSTGGLICALYSQRHPQRVKALWLNSPFLDWNLGAVQRAQLAIAAGLGRFFPFLHDGRVLSQNYVQSLHRDYAGEWDFDLALKPAAGFPVHFGWLRAISAAHAQVHAGLTLGCPVLSMHSDEADIVLDWRHIAKWSPTLGTRVSV